MSKRARDVSSTALGRVESHLHGVKEDSAEERQPSAERPRSRCWIVVRHPRWSFCSRSCHPFWQVSGRHFMHDWQTERANAVTGSLGSYECIDVTSVFVIPCG